MAWEWVGPTATASTAIAGIVATYLTAARSRQTTLAVTRLTLEAGRANQLRDERREAFSNYLAVIDRIDSLLRALAKQVEIANNMDHSPERRREAQEKLRFVMDEHEQAASQLLGATYRVFLVSSKDLRTAVTGMPAALKAASKAAHEGRYQPVDSQALAPIHVLMRRELGIEPS